MTAKRSAKDRAARRRAAETRAARARTVAARAGTASAPSEPSESSPSVSSPSSPTSSAAGASAGTLTSLDLAALNRWAFRARGALGEYRARLDDLNVFPVPDGDTGTNLFLTLDGALESLVREGTPGGPSGLAQGARGLARCILLSARGNSGVILGLLVRGLADGLDAAGGGAVDGRLLARALTEANRLAWQGVSDPVEGTILSVARAAARAAQEVVDAAPPGGEVALVGVVEAALSAARAALARTPEELPTLARAGVVDAGGAGLVLILGALEEVVTGRPVALDIASGGANPPTPQPDPPTDCSEAPAGRSTHHDAHHGAHYEVVYLLERCDDAAAGRLRARLAELGDSLVVAGDAHLRTVHVHTPDAGAVIEAALPLGHVHGIRVTALPADVPATPAPAAAEPDDDPEGILVRARALTHHADPVGVVACASGPGIAAEFAFFGARPVPDTPTRRASPQQILAAVHAQLRRTGAPIVVLPNDPDARLACTAAAEMAADDDIDVRVVPTVSPVQGLAAVSVLDPDEGPRDRLDGIVHTARRVRIGSVERAARDGAVGAHTAARGQFVSFVGSEAVGVGSDLPEVTARLVLALAAGHRHPETATLLGGRALDDVEGLARWVDRRLEGIGAGLEFTVVDGGQSHPLLLVGVE